MQNSEYSLFFHKKAKASLSKVAKSNMPLAVQIKKALEKIRSNPFIGLPLSGSWKGYFKYRVREYRIVYEIKDDKLIVYVLRIRHRRDVYDKS
jgi:mRNA interferase RelE/StbE